MLHGLEMARLGFNSYMVRLEVLNQVKFLLAKLSFNSYMVRLEDKRHLSYT